MKKLKSPDQTEWEPKATMLKEGEDKEIKEKVLNEKIKKYMNRVQEYEDNKCNVFTIVLGQCSDALQAKLRGEDNWEDIFDDNNLVKIMESIEVWMLNHTSITLPN